MCQIWSLMRSLPCNHISSNRSIKSTLNYSHFFHYLFTSLQYTCQKKHFLLACLLPGVLCTSTNPTSIFSLLNTTHVLGDLEATEMADRLQWLVETLICSTENPFHSFSQYICQLQLGGCRAVGDKVTFALSIVTLKNTQEAQGKSI